MSRQEALNTFTEGLVMDLNPLTTPNNVLTDCLNGTIITYNDNEFILQNDQGNYKLKNAKLKENFIPIGVKEHANILYIVSYNPITRETEIGSYPSPQRIFKDNIEINNQDLTPIVSATTTGTMTYENLVKTANLSIYTDPNDMDKLFLNPGDLFKLNFPISQVTSHFPYQGVKFYVLSENKELFPIDLTNYLNEDFQHVFWETPGWITVKYSLANLDAFNLNIKTLEIPEFYTSDSFKLGKLTVNAQIEISDALFFINNEINSNLKTSDLKVRVTINKVDANNTSTKLISDKDFSNFTNVSHEDFSILYKDINLIEYIGKADFKGTDTIEIDVVPIITSGSLTIVYEQFRTKYSINLSSVSNTKNLSIAQNTFRYYVQESGLALTFDVQGSFLNNSAIKVDYNIYKYNTSGEVQSIYKQDQNIPDINLFGQNTISLNWIPGTFEKENAYIISFLFKDSTQTLKRINKLLVTSELFNDFRTSVKDFNTIPGYDWISKYNTSLKVVDPKIEQDGIINYSSNISSKYLNPFPTKSESDYTYIKKSSENAEFKDVVYRIEQNVTVPLKLNGEIASIQGELWQGLNSKSTIDYIRNGEKVEGVPVDLQSGTFKIDDMFYYEESIGLFPEIKNKELKVEHRKYFIEGMHYGKASTGFNTTIPEDELDIMAETYYDCPESGKDQTWNVRMRFRHYKDNTYSENTSVVVGYNDVNNVRLDSVKWVDALGAYARFMKANKVPMLVVRMNGNDEFSSLKWHGNIHWLDRGDYTATPNDGEVRDLYYVLMQSAATSYFYDTNKSATASSLSVMLLPVVNKSTDPITFPGSLKPLIDEVNQIAKAVYLVTKLDKNKWDVFTYENKSNVNSHLELDISSICLKISFSEPTFHGKSMFKAESLAEIGQMFNTISDKIYNLEPSLIKSEFNISNFTLSYSNLPLITSPVYLNAPGVIKTNKPNEFTAAATTFNNDLIKAKDLQQNEALEFASKTDITTRKAGEFGWDPSKTDLKDLDVFVSQLTTSNSNGAEYTLGDVCLKASSTPRRVRFFRDDGFGSRNESACFALEAFDTNYLP